jgi:acyl carrier protein
MTEMLSHSILARVTAVVQRLLMERSLNTDVTPESALLNSGLTSIDMVNLVLSVEAEFDLTFAEKDMNARNFGTIATIEQLVSSMVRNA